MTVFAVILCVVLAAVCSAAEHAFAEASRSKLDDMLEDRERAGVDRLLEKREELGIVAGICRTLLEIAAVVVLALHLSSGLALFGWSVLLVLVIAEIIPRLLVERSPEAVLVFTLPAFHALAWPALPLAGGLLALARFVRKTSDQATQEEDEAAEEILSAVVEGEKEGLIAGDQADMIENIIELRDVDVAEIMTPRLDMASVNVDEPLEKIIDAAVKSGHSRLPVFRETRDDIVGILFVHDLIAGLGAKPDAAPSIRSLMRPPYFVPETMRISDVLRHFHKHETTMAIVVDEYGGTAGLVTISDVVDTIVGEVRDQHEPQREPAVTVIDDRTLEADARTAVRRLNEDFGTDIPESEEYDTVAGYLCYTLGRVPDKDDRTVCGKTELLVLGADDRRVHNVRITVAGGIRTDSRRSSPPES